MISEKQLEEEMIRKHQFRANPIPDSTMLPRYKQILEKNEQRRHEVKTKCIEMTKQNEKPFNIY